MADEWADFRIPQDQAWDEFRPGVTPTAAKSAGLSDDEIKRNYALGIANRGEEPTTLFGYDKIPSWIPFYGGKTPTTTATAAPDPALGTVGSFAQGLPVVGAAVPDLPSMDWLKREHPNVAKGAHIVGNVAGTVPAMAMAPAGIPGAMLAGGLLSGGDTAARQVYDPNTGILDPSKFDPTRTAIDTGVGAGFMGFGRGLSRIVSPTNKVASKFQFPEYQNLPEGIKNVVGAGGVALAAAPHIAHGNYWGALQHGTEAGLASHYAAPYLYDVAKPIVNRAIANRANPYFQDIINALMGGSTSGAKSTE